MVSAVENLLKEVNVNLTVDGVVSEGGAGVQLRRLAAIVQKQKDFIDHVLAQMRKKGYPTGHEWTVLVDCARIANEDVEAIARGET